MKFNIHGSEFKTIIDRISAVVPNKTPIIGYTSIKITAKGNSIIFEAMDTINFATINAYANVYEEGCTYVLLSDLKKVLGVNSEITVTSDNEKIEIRNSKKSYEVRCYEFDWPEMPVLDNNDVMCAVRDNEFINHLSKIDCMRAHDNSINPMLSTFCMDLPNKKIVVLDSHRIGIVKLSNGMFCENREKLIVEGTIYKSLKSLVGKSKQDNNIDIYADEKNIMFCGDDWTLITKRVLSEYFPYERMISDIQSTKEYSFEFDQKELGNIAKEYCKVITKNQKTPMIFYNNNGRIATSIEVGDYKTSDTIENIVPKFGMDNEFFCGFDPEFIEDACKVFDCKAEMYGTYSSKKPIVMTDDTYDVLILPINMVNANLAFVKKQVA